MRRLTSPLTVLPVIMLWMLIVSVSGQTMGNLASEVVSLDGNDWRLITDPTNVGLSQAWYNSIRPGAVTTRVPWVIQEKYPGYHGVAWYWHTFTAPINPHAAGKYLLRFWSVGYKGTVWLNGVNIGEHEGADTPFVLDATAAINPGGSNLVAVRVVDPTQSGIDGLIRSQIPGGKVFPHAGIEDSVELLVYPAIYFEDLYVKPSSATGIITIEATVQNTLGISTTGNFACSVSPTDMSSNISATLSPGSNILQTNLLVEDPHLWDLDDPFLYHVTANIWQDGSDSYDQRVVRSGFRDFRVENGHFRLNGRRIFLRCAHTGQQDPIGIRVAYDPDWPLDDIRMMKAMGFNSIRFFQALGYRRQLEFCDEYGFLVYEEARGGWLIDYAAGAYEQRRDNVIGEMILRDRNHPSVVMWGLLNESPWAIYPNSAEFNHASGSLALIRSLDDSRVVMLSSGRWDTQIGIGSVSNPGSNIWQCLLGNETPGALPITPYCQPGGPPPAPPAVPIAGYVGPMGDIHVYPRVPHTAEIINFLRTVGAGTKNVFITEYGIASTMDLPRMCELYQQYGFSHMEYAHGFQNRLNLFMNDWDRWNLSECFGEPSNYFHQCFLYNSSQRLVGINALRANPDVMGYSLTAAVDTWNAGEGVFSMFREEKPGMPEAISDGFASLRWCLFAEPGHVYRNGPLHLDAVLANEDAIAPGYYWISLKVYGPDETQVFDRHIYQLIPDPQGSGEPPLTLDILSEDIIADWPEGEYRFTASFDDPAIEPTGSEIKFYVTDAATMPAVSSEVVLWGQDETLYNYLVSHGISVRQFAGEPQTDPELILVGRQPASPGSQAAFDDLTSRIDQGSTVLFLCPEVFSDGSNPTAYVPLSSKGTPASEFQTSFVYPKDIWAKQHPIFAGMPAGGVMDYTYYRELFADALWQNQDTPAEAVAGAIANSFSYYSGLRIGLYNRGQGSFILNMFQIRENLGVNPAAERLLRNMLGYLGEKIYLLGDLDRDHRVDESDFSSFASQWQMNGFQTNSQWDHQAGFEAIWDAVTNPAMVWGYGVFTGGPYSGWNIYTGQWTDSFIGFKGWILDGPDDWGSCNIHNRDDVFTNPNWFPGVGMSWRPFQAGIFTPWVNSNAAPGVRFTAPVTDEYEVNIEFENRVPTGSPTGVYVLVNGSEVLNTVISGFTESNPPSPANLADYTINSLPLQAGETITFGVYTVSGQLGGHIVGVDAVISGTSLICGGPGFVYLDADLDKNCAVDFLDFAILADNWLADNTTIE